MATRKLVKIRKQKLRMKSRPGKLYSSYHVSIPPSIASKIPESMRFSVELTNDGILLRPHKTVAPTPPPPPEWLTEQNNRVGE